MSKKVISFSLWGSSPKYCIGAIKNSELREKIYPDWVCRFYCAQDVPNEIITELSRKSEVVNTGKSGNWKFTTERLLALDDEVELVIFRDTDSRLSIREKEAVYEWVESDKTIHIMRDHPSHGSFPILAGMWGAKKETFNISISSLLSLYSNSEQYHYDQIFIEKYIWRSFGADAFFHDEIFTQHPFPSPREGLRFVGEVFDENDNHTPEHSLILKKHLEQLSA